MSNATKLSLIVLRVADLDRAVEFYSVLGLVFEREQHGSGPVHFSTYVGETVLELYPASERFPVGSARLGFSVDSIESVLEIWRQAGCKVVSEPKESPYGIRAVAVDPDGHYVELLQNPE